MESGCEGEPLEIVKCESQPYHCPYWSGWAEWREVSCGSVRTRNCERVIQDPMMNCIGDSLQKISCWSDWSDCDFEHSCKRSRSRKNVDVIETEVSVCTDGVIERV